MEDVSDEAYYRIKDELIKAEDEVITSGYLKPIVVHGDSWPEHFIQEEDVFNKNPYEEFDSESPIFVIVKPRAQNFGKTDGCEFGSWRIMGRDKLIKSKKSGKILGFKKILKFCNKTKPREYKRSWVMEEFRLADKWNWKQDHVICKIRLLFETEIISLLNKHFSYLSTSRNRSKSVPVHENQLLPDYGFYSSDPKEMDVFNLQALYESDGKCWPNYITNDDVYRLHPLKLVDLRDQMFMKYGTCIFANRKETCGKTNECQGGYWKIMETDRLIRTSTGMVMGFKRVYKFREEDEGRRYVSEGEAVKVTWTMEEYRLAKKVMQNKVMCVIKLMAIPSNPKGN